MAYPTRRDWMRLVGAGGAAAALGCGESTSATADLGLAVFEPTADALLVSLWARAAREVTLEVRDGDSVTTHTVALSPTGTAALDLRDLRPSTYHELVLTAGDLRLGPYHTRTAPRDDDPRPIRLAVTADVDPSTEFDTDLASHLVEAAPELLVMLGDFPYTDNGPVALDLETYRERHAECRTLAKVRTLLQAMPVRAIYDDHEFRNNWDAHFVTEEAARYAASMTVWDEFFPLREAPADIRYRSWRWGAHAECFLLDCRRFRSANDAPDGPAKTMLGAAQLAWFTDAIARSTATFKLVFTSVPLDFGVGVDHWAGFRTERQRVFEAVLGIRGVVFFSADQHWFAAHQHAYGIREFQVGPFARGILTPPPEVSGVLFRERDYNAGLIDIDGERLRVTGLGPGGRRFFSVDLLADDLTPA